MTYKDKSGLISSRLLSGCLSLELGVGARKVNPDSIGIDLIDGPACDVVGDVIEVLQSLPDSCVESVYASHFIEHVESVSELLGSLVRVCMPGATVRFIAPHFSNPHFYSDPTHIAGYGLYTFAYYAQSNLFRRSVPSYCLIDGLVLAGVVLRFKSYPPCYIRHFLKKVFQRLINSSCWSKELYEETFCWILPCYEVQYDLFVEKMQEPNDSIC